MSNTFTLQNWECLGSGPYVAPELRVIRLVGYVYGHPSRPDGHKIQTTRIVDAQGRIITTRSGTQYRLGRISPAYRRWLRKADIPYNAKCPIVVHDLDVQDD